MVTTDPPKLIVVEGLTKSYGKVEAVKDISFSVSAGEIYGLLGPNGAGKSTTINIVSGLILPGAGEIHIAGFDTLRESISAKRVLGVVPQMSIVVEELSALENCMFFGSLYGVARSALRERALHLLDWIGLGDKRSARVGSFSGGQLRRLTLVLGLLHEPRALVLDEPTVGLDPQTRLLLLERIEEVAKGGTAVLLSTHYLEEAERLCHRIGVIDHGKIIKEGTLGELRRAVSDVQLFGMRGNFDHESLLTFVSDLDGGEVVLEAENEITVSVPAGSNDGNRLLEHASGLDGISEVSIRPPSLESLFIRLTGRELRE